MINLQIVRKFVARELECHDHLKNMKYKKLEKILKREDPDFKFNTKPYKHQLVCFLLGVFYSRFLFFPDMGLGKSKVVLDLFRFHKKHGRAARMLVLVPNSTNVDDWLEDNVPKHAPDLKAGGLQEGMTSDERTHVTNNTDLDLVVMTYAGFMHLVCKTVQRKDGTTRMNYNMTLMKRAHKLFDFMVLDESTLVRNRASLYHRMVLAFSKKAKFCYALTGTPYGKDQTHVWAQFKTIDLGESLGDTLGLFRAVFYTESDGAFGGKDFMFRRKMSDLLSRMMAHRSISFSKEECLDMPPYVEVVRKAACPKDVWDYHQRLLEEFQDPTNSIKVRGNKFHQMRQLSSGYLELTDPEGGRQTVTFKKNAKLEALMSDVVEMPAGSKAIIFHDYKTTGKVLHDRMKKEGIGAVRVYSGTKDKKAAIKKFKKDPKCQILVLNMQSGAYGLNLQVAEYQLFFELPTDPAIFRQAKARANRGGQTKKVTSYFYLLTGTKDSESYEALVAGNDVYQQIVYRR